MAKNESKKVVVRFLKKSRPYNAGEIAGFPHDGDFLKMALQQGIVEVVGTAGEPQTAGPSAAKVK